MQSQLLLWVNAITYVYKEGDSSASPGIGESLPSLRRAHKWPRRCTTAEECEAEIKMLFSHVGSAIEIAMLWTWRKVERNRERKTKQLRTLRANGQVESCGRTFFFFFFVQDTPIKAKLWFHGNWWSSPRRKARSFLASLFLLYVSVPELTAFAALWWVRAGWKLSLQESQGWFSAEQIPVQVNGESLGMCDWGPGAKRAGLPLWLSAWA